MDKKIAMKWVEALRSGKYKQGQIYLNKNNKFCCLGVLCEISKAKKTKAKYGRYAYGIQKEDTAGLPLELTKKLKLTSFGALLKTSVEDKYGTLAALNDSGEFNFNEIADIIQIEYVEGL